MVLPDSPLLGLLGGHTDVQSWSLGLEQVLDAALRRKGKALTLLQAFFSPISPALGFQPRKEEHRAKNFHGLCPTEQTDT